MGIRLHVMLGYGLMLDGADKTNLDWEFLDNGEAFRSVLLEARSELKDDIDKLTLSDSFVKASNLFDVVKYDEEFGFEDRLLLIPFPNNKEFSRYGDLLDTYIYEVDHPGSYM